MGRNAVICALCLSAVLAGGMVRANELLQTCGGLTIDYAKSEITIDGRTYRTTIEQFDAVAGRFDVRLAHASDLSEGEARLQAILSTSVTCMKLDSSSIEIGPGRPDGDDWVHASGCIDKNLRMADKC